MRKIYFFIEEFLYCLAGFVKTDSQIEEMLETGRLTMYPEVKNKGK
jgi:hypothetical protein